jgi:hypothetical protein
MALNHFPRIIICFWLVSLYACQAQHGPTSLEEADRLYFQFKAEESLAMYDEIRLAESYSMKDRAKAGIKMAKMQWLFYGNLESAISILQSMENSPVERANVFLLWSRVLRTENAYKSWL